MGNKDHEAFVPIQKKNEAENFTGYCQRTARAASTILDEDEALIFCLR